MSILGRWPILVEVDIPSDVSDRLLCRFLLGHRFLLPSEPGTLSWIIDPICPNSADGLHSIGTRQGRVFPAVSGGFTGVGAPRDARDVRNEPHFRSRISISGGSGCADDFPMAVREALYRGGLSYVW